MLVLQAAGTNCDAATAEACRLAGGSPEVVHLNALLRKERRLDEFGMLVIPGGFSYGDHLGAGSMLTTVLRHRLLPEIHEFIARRKARSWGVRNGFQVLARLGLLGGVALAPNSTGKFQCKWVRLRAGEPDCLFLRGIDALPLHRQRPGAHLGATRSGTPVSPSALSRTPTGRTATSRGSATRRGTSRSDAAPGACGRPLAVTYR